MIRLIGSSLLLVLLTAGAAAAQNGGGADSSGQGATPPKRPDSLPPAPPNRQVIPLQPPDLVQRLMYYRVVPDAAGIRVPPLATPPFNFDFRPPSQAGKDPIYDIGNGVAGPVPVKRVEPSYTSAAKEAKVQGEVRLGAVVEKDGTVSTVTVTKSLDRKYGLDQEAVEAAKRWAFKPGTKDGRPVRVRVELILEFRLR